MKNFVLVVITLFIFAGCTSISKQTLREVDKDITIEMVQEHPDKYIGKKVLWGGTVLNSENLEKVSEVEVLESDLAYDNSPKDGTSHGRFLIQTKRYLDSQIYKENKRITVAGTVKGIETRRIGQMEYPYPVVEPLEMRLFEPPSAQPYSEYPYMYGPYPYSPYGPYSPMSPFGPYYPYGPYSPYGPYPYRPFPY